MAGIGQIRGAILEEAVSFLLRKVGYRIATHRDFGTRNGHSGLEVQGRGCWHQIDTLACFDASPAFMYPLRLLVEAKCYKTKIGVGVIRNAVGVLKDISENYFTLDAMGNESDLQIQRFNYHGAVYSSSGFSKVAQHYAIAHQIFLIDYAGIHVMKPIIDEILSLELSDFSEEEQNNVRSIREAFGNILGNNNQNLNTVLSGKREK